MLALRDLRKAFGRTVAVDGLSLSIERGEVFGLLGPNGAGKSTTIGMGMGLLRPDAGSVVLHTNSGDAFPTDPRARRLIGVAPQALALYEDLTARENAAFFARMYGLGGAELRRRCDELLDRVGLLDRAGSRAATYSGGMKRRLNLACALVHDPVLVMLDEPTAGVDPQSRNAIFDMVRALRDEGRTIVYTTHYMEEAQRLCDRVGIIDHGRLLALGTVDDLIGCFGGRSVIRLEKPDGDTRVESHNPLADLPRLLEDRGATAVHIERPDLESVFLSLTGRSLRD